MSVTYCISVHQLYLEEQGDYPICVPTGRKVVRKDHKLYFEIDKWRALQRQFFFSDDTYVREEGLGYEWYSRVSVFQNTPLHLIKTPVWLGEPHTGWTYPSEFKNLSYESEDLDREFLDEDEILIVEFLKLVSKLSDEKFVVFVSNV